MFSHFDLPKGQDLAYCKHKKCIYKFDRYREAGREGKARLVKLQIFSFFNPSNWQLSNFLCFSYLQKNFSAPKKVYFLLDIYIIFEIAINIKEDKKSLIIIN